MSQPNFDWVAFLKSQPTDHEWQVASCLSGSWNTCPTSLTDIPRDKAGVPRDYILFQLGNGFNAAIKQRDMPQAEVFMARIAERLAYLKTDSHEPAKS